MLLFFHMRLVKEIEDKKAWEDFISGSGDRAFLQSWVWGEFQKTLGKKVFRIAVTEGSEMILACQFYLEKAKLGSFLYAPASPSFERFSASDLAIFISKIKELASIERAVFVRLDPGRYTDAEKEFYKSQGFIESPQFTQPECTAVVDLTKNESELRSALSGSTRNNINAAARKGLTVRQGNLGEINIFLKLLGETAGRKELTLPAQKNYHEKQFEVLGSENQMKLFIAEVGDNPISAALVVDFSGVRYYLHAANSLAKKELRASYPLVWQVVMDAKKSGLSLFDFWGVAPSDDLSHSWSGVTAFKMSFGAERKYYQKPLDLPLGANYQLMKVVELWRRPLRKLLRF